MKSDRRARRVFKFKKKSLTLDFLGKTPKSIKIVPDDDHPYKVSVVENNSLIYLSVSRNTYNL